MQCSQGPFCSLRNLKPLIAFALLHKQRPASLLKALPHLDKALAASYCQGVLYLLFVTGSIETWSSLFCSPILLAALQEGTFIGFQWFPHSCPLGWFPSVLIKTAQQSSAAVLCIIGPAPRHAATLCLLSTFLGYILKHQQENRLVSIHALNMNS